MERKKDNHKKFSIDDRFKKWHFSGKNYKDDISRDLSDCEQETKHKRKLEIHKLEDDRERMSSPKRSFPFLQVKTFLTHGNPRHISKDPIASGKEEKRKKKKKEKETALLRHEIPHLISLKKSLEPINLKELKHNKKDNVIKERKKRLERPKKKHKNDKYAVVKVVHPSFPEGKEEAEGKAVVIYHRRNQKYLQNHMRDGHGLERVPYLEGCDTPVGPVQSKRCVSEPRQKENYIARHKTRFPVEPFKMVSPDFRTAIDFFKQTNGSIECNKFEDITQLEPTDKYSRSTQQKLFHQKSTESVLENIAEKKLNLHKELIRSENSGNKKFWDSIDESLNYRCALAEMFSTQSFLTKESSFLQNSNTIPQANIYVRESVISSYQLSNGDLPSTMNSFQGFGRFQTNPLQITQPLTAFRTLFINRSRESLNDRFLRNQKFRSKSSDESTSAYQLWDEPETLLRQENFVERDIQLESLMTKLSEEITKCSRYLRQLEEEKLIRSTTIENTVPLDWKATRNPIFVYSTTGMEYKKREKSPRPKSTDEDQSKPQTTKLKFSPTDTNSTKSPQETDSQFTDSSKYFIKGGKASEKLKSTSSNSTSTLDEKQVSKSSESSTTEDGKMTRKNVSKTNEIKTKFDPVLLDEFICCTECNRLKERILKLKKELEKLEKKMPLYPKEYQDSVKECLQGLHMTSDTFLKRMNSCAKLRQKDICKNHKHKTHSKRTLSAPDPVVHECRKKTIELAHTNSDYRMNVGLEIKMENVDPITGKKLRPPMRGGFEQEGNVKCRLLQDGKKPLLVLDTDFLYSPEKGMLFGKRDESLSTDLVIPLSQVVKPEPFKQFQYVTLQPETPQEQSCVNTCPDQDNSGDSLDLCTMNDLKHSCSKELIAKEEETKPTEDRPKTVSFSKKSERPCSLIPVLRRQLPPTIPKTWPSSKGNASTVSVHPLEVRPRQLTSILKLAKLFSFTWTFGFFLCKLVHYMQNVSAICSVLTLTAMSLERYYAIVHPMKAQYICTISQARRIITATWVSAFLLAVPILFAQVHLRVGVKVEAYWCVRDWDNKVIWRAHELYMMLLILVVPTGVMAVAYTAICCEIWEVMQRRQDMTSGKGHGICRKARLERNSSNDSFCNSTTRVDRRRGWGFLKKELTDDGASVKQVIKMLVAVVVIYVICWGPMLIDNVLQAYGILSHIRMGWLKYMGTTFHLMAYFNSCINPIIYGFMSKNFRESFRKTLCCWQKKPKTANRSFSLSQTRNTSIRYAESSFGRNTSIALPV